MTEKKPKRTLATKIKNKLKRKLRIQEATSTASIQRSVYSYSEIPYVHAPFVAAVVESIRSKTPRRGITTAESGLRTLRLMDTVLSDFYGGRHDNFWENSSRWKSKQNTHVLNEYEKVALAIQEPSYRLSNSDIAHFLEHGYVGPFTCESSEIKSLPVLPVTEDDLHSTNSQVKEICSHPSIVCRVSQLLASQEVKLFKSRFHVKLPNAADCPDKIVPWHQDVGDRNGGFRSDGSPVPTITVWLSIDGVTEERGPVLVLPGSHRRFYGDWKRNFRSKLEKQTNLMTDIEHSEAHPFIAKAGQFFIFNSWILHSSSSNRSDSPRVGINMRFMSQEHEVEPVFKFISLVAQ